MFEFEVFIPCLNIYQQLENAFVQQKANQNDLIDLVNKNNRSFLINNKLEPFLIIINKQNIFSYFNQHFNEDNVLQVLNKAKIKISQSQRQSQILNETKRTQSEIFKQSIFEIVLNKQQYQYFIQTDQYFFYLSLQEIKFDASLYQTTKLKNIQVSIALPELLMDQIINKNLQEFNLQYVKASDFYQINHLCEIQKIEVIDCLEIDFSSIIQIPLIYFQISVQNIVGNQNIQIQIENYEIVVEEAQDIQSDSLMLNKSTQESIKDQITFYNKESYSLGAGEKVQLLSSIDTIKRINQYQLQNVKTEQLLCSNCQSLLQSKQFQERQSTQLVLSQIQNSVLCQCEQLGMNDIQGRFNVSINIGIKFQDKQENIITFYDHVEVPKKPQIQLGILMQQKEYKKGESFQLTITIINKTFNDLNLVFSSDDILFESSLSDYQGIIQVEQSVNQVIDLPLRTRELIAVNYIGIKRGLVKIK